MTEPRIFNEWLRPSVPMEDDDLDAAVHLVLRMHHTTGERAECARTIAALLLEVGRLRKLEYASVPNVQVTKYTREW